MIGIFLFYRAVVPQTYFDIEYVAFDERTPGVEGHLFVELFQTPSFRVITWLTGWKPRIPMHIHFHLTKSNLNEEDKTKRKWLIDSQEDVIQPLVRDSISAAVQYVLTCPSESYAHDPNP